MELLPIGIWPIKPLEHTTIQVSHNKGQVRSEQAERIAIARGLLRPGSILLLDEISSSLDAPTEAELYTRLFKAYPQKTMIFITHRETVTTLCDETLKL